MSCHRGCARSNADSVPVQTPYQSHGASFTMSKHVCTTCLLSVKLAPRETGTESGSNVDYLHVTRKINLFVIYLISECDCHA